MLILVGFLFLLTHLGVSSTKVRGHIVRLVGEKVYLLTYSMAIGVSVLLHMDLFGDSSVRLPMDA